METRERHATFEDTVSQLRFSVQCVPFDVLGLIFSELRYGILTALVYPMFVCRSWRNSLNEHPTLWRKITIPAQNFIPNTPRCGRESLNARLKIHPEHNCDAPLDISIGFPGSQEIHDTCTHRAQWHTLERRHDIKHCAEVKDRHLCLQLVLEALAGDEGNNMKC